MCHTQGGIKFLWDTLFIYFIMFIIIIIFLGVVFSLEYWRGLVKIAYGPTIKTNWNIGKIEREIFSWTKTGSLSVSSTCRL